MDALNNIIRSQGLHLTPRETQNIIKCAHLLGNVLTKAIERRSKSTEIEDPEVLLRKKTMTLDLKETVIPLEVKEEKRCETATTQTDISLPNTKSAPRIFENILRQLSRSSIDVSKIENKDDGKDKSETNKSKDASAKGKETPEGSKEKTDATKDNGKDTPKKEKVEIDKVENVKRNVEFKKEKSADKDKDDASKDKEINDVKKAEVIDDKTEVKEVVGNIETIKDNTETNIEKADAENESELNLEASKTDEKKDE